MSYQRLQSPLLKDEAIKNRRGRSLVKPKITFKTVEKKCREREKKKKGKEKEEREREER